MARSGWNVVVMCGVSLLAVASSGQRAPSRVLRGAEAATFAPLEERAARSPDDAGAVVALAQAFVDRGSPGMALAVLERSPSVLERSPAAADVASAALIGVGDNARALAMAHKAMSRCDEGACAGVLMARVAQREEMLSALVAAGINDLGANPEGAEVAYRRAVRQVRIALNDAR